LKALRQLAKEIREITATSEMIDRDQRIDRISLDLVNLRPRYEEAVLLLSALKTGLALREGPYGDDLPIEVEHAYLDLLKAMDAAEYAKFVPEAYSPEEE
jgi:hypothetical protein